MSRSVHYPRSGPRTSLIANREVERALQHGGTPAFGIRRPFEQECGEAIANRLLDMQAQGEISPEPKLIVRDPAITLLSQRVIGRQLMRGVIAGYNLGRARAKLARSPSCSARDSTLMVERGEIEVYRGRFVYSKLFSAEVEDEVGGIQEALAIAGLKGVSGKGKPPVPHATWLETGKGYVLSVGEQAALKAKLEEEIPHELTVEGWESYPFDIFQMP